MVYDIDKWMLNSFWVGSSIYESSTTLEGRNGRIRNVNVTPVQTLESFGPWNQARGSDKPNGPVEEEWLKTERMGHKTGKHNPWVIFGRNHPILSATLAYHSYSMYYLLFSSYFWWVKSLTSTEPSKCSGLNLSPTCQVWLHTQRVQSSCSTHPREKLTWKVAYVGIKSRWPGRYLSYSLEFSWGKILGCG